MRRTHLQQTLLLLIVILALGLLISACSRLSESERERLNQLTDQGSAFAATVAADAPSYAATAKAAAATAVAIAPTVAVDAQVAGATVAANAQVLAQQANETGESLLIWADRVTTRLGTLQPDENGNIVAVISEAELTGLVIRDEANSDGRFQNLAVTFDDGSILLTGDLTRPVETPFAVVFLPFVEDGVLNLAISSSSIGSIQLPQVVINRAESRINRTLQTLIETIPGDVQVTAVAVTPGVLTITARR